MQAGPSRRRRVLPIVIATACAAAVIGAAVLWLRPPHTVSRSGAPGAVIGAPGTPFPNAVVRSGSKGGPGDRRPVGAPAFSLTVLSAGTRPSAAAPPAGGPPVVIPAPGARLALAALRGHPVVVNFWASWCGPCRAEMPLLVKTWHAYAARGVVVLGLDVDDTPADARRFLADYHVDYPIVTVPGDRLLRAYGVIGLPTTVFVDASGTIRAREVGGFVGADGERTLARRLDALLTTEGR